MHTKKRNWGGLGVAAHARHAYGIGGPSPRDFDDVSQDLLGPGSPTGPMQQTRRNIPTDESSTDDLIAVEGPNHKMPYHEGSIGNNLKDLTHGRVDAPLDDFARWPQSYADGVYLGASAVGRKILQRLRPKLADAAQSVYDTWDASDEDWGDADVGFGGICHVIADAMAEILTNAGVEAYTQESLLEDVHAWVLAVCSDGVWRVDIPPGVYETGSGYSWTKRPDVEIQARDVVIEHLDEDPQAIDHMIEREAKTAQSHAPWVAVDLDGTILEPAAKPQTGAQRPFGKPRPGAAEALSELLSLGWRVSIYTARISNHAPNHVAQHEARQIRDYLQRQNIPFSDIWIGRKPRCHWFIDDRAIQFDGRWDQIVKRLLTTEPES